MIKLNTVPFRVEAVHYTIEASRWEYNSSCRIELRVTQQYMWGSP